MAVVQGAIADWPDPIVPALPIIWESLVGTVSTVIAAYIRAQPHKLSVIPADPGAMGRAFPTARSWFKLAARMLAACEAAGLGEEDVITALGGCVGNGHAAELLAWRHNLDLADPEELLWYLFWLSDKVGRRLRKDNYQGRTVTLTVRAFTASWVWRPFSPLGLIASRSADSWLTP